MFNQTEQPHRAPNENENRKLLLLSITDTDLTCVCPAIRNGSRSERPPAN